MIKKNKMDTEKIVSIVKILNKEMITLNINELEMLAVLKHMEYLLRNKNSKINEICLALEQESQSKIIRTEVLNYIG